MASRCAAVREYVAWHAEHAIQRMSFATRGSPKRACACATAGAAPRVLFRGCAHWTMPFCPMMKATNGKTYQLLDAGPAFPGGTRVIVVGNQGGEVGLCFAPTAKVLGFKVLPPGPC